MPLKALHTVGETTGRKTPQHARLSDISNTTNACFSSHQDENQLFSKVSDTQLQKDLIALKKALAEKDEIIEAQKVNAEKFRINYMNKAKQNQDIIRQNARLFKELMQARDRLKILQHENAQMTSAHKVYKSELQDKLAKALERIDIPQKETSTSEKMIPCDKQATVPNMLSKLAESKGRRTVNSYEALNEPLNCVQDEGLEYHATCRSTLRRRASLSYKEPSLKAKLRQPENNTPGQMKPSINRRESRIHQLHKLWEDEPSKLSYVMPCKSESGVIEGDLSPILKSASELAASSHSLPPDMLECQASLSSSKSEDRPHAASTSHCEFASIADDVSSGRPPRRSVTSISSYKEAPLNSKLRQPS